MKMVVPLASQLINRKSHFKLLDLLLRVLGNPPTCIKNRILFKTQIKNTTLYKSSYGYLYTA